MPDDSQYHNMVERAQEEQALLMKNRRQNPSYYNKGYVLPDDPVDGYNLDNSSSKSSPGKVKAKSVPFGSIGSNSTLRSQGGFLPIPWCHRGMSWGGVYSGASHCVAQVCIPRAHHTHCGRWEVCPEGTSFTSWPM